MEFTKPQDENNKLQYPVTQEQKDSLDGSSFVSVRVGQERGFKLPDDFDIEEKAKEIELVRKDIQEGKTPHWFLKKYWPYEFEYKEEMPQPLINEGLSFDYPDGLADVVHMDMPTQMPEAVFRWLLSEGANIKDKDGKYKYFLKTVPNTLEYIADGVNLALEKGFRVKYFFGVARPEEVLGYNMTAYPEGCPGHPSFPAGHGSAAGGGVKRIINVFELTQEQLEVVLTTAYLWSQFRSFAGVHYAEDNVLGLIVGSLGAYFKPSELAKYIK